MSVQKIGFVGLRSTDLAGLRRVLENGLNMRPSEVTGDQVGYRLADGTRFEAYGEANAFHRFFDTGPVVGFAVEDFDASWTRLRQLGIEPLTEIQEKDGCRWVHFRLPDGTIAEIIGGSGVA